MSYQRPTVVGYNGFATSRTANGMCGWVVSVESTEVARDHLGVAKCVNNVIAYRFDEAA